MARLSKLQTWGPAALQGEDQKKLDIVSNEVFCNALRNSGKTGVIASEEEDFPVAVEETYSGTFVGLSLGFPLRCCNSLLDSIACTVFISFWPVY